MNFKRLFLIPLIALFSFATPALAEDDNQPIQPNSGQSGIRNPEGGNHEPGEFKHQVDERHEGSGELIQFVIVGGALVIAALLAYQAGKRRRSNYDEKK